MNDLSHDIKMPDELIRDPGALLFGYNARLITIDEQIAATERRLNALRVQRTRQAREVERLLARWREARR